LRFHRWSVVRAVAALAVAALGACTPYRHADIFYEMPPAELRALEQRAIERCAAARGTLPPYAFTTDGCSAWRNGEWLDCCVEHDILYWCGGSAPARAAGDWALQACVAARGHPLTADLMHLGVRIGGHPWLPFPWRWGYGWNWPYRYDPTP
jgi:hypothetical protein